MFDIFSYFISFIFWTVFLNANIVMRGNAEIYQNISKVFDCFGRESAKLSSKRSISLFGFCQKFWYILIFRLRMNSCGILDETVTHKNYTYIIHNTKSVLRKHVMNRCYGAQKSALFEHPVLFRTQIILYSVLPTNGCTQTVCSNEAV